MHKTGQNQSGPVSTIDGDVSSRDQKFALLLTTAKTSFVSFFPNMADFQIALKCKLVTLPFKSKLISLSINWNSIRLGGHINGIVTKTIHTFLAGSVCVGGVVGGGRGSV